MAELVTLLMLTVSQLLGAGVPPGDLALRVQETVMEHPPVPIESVAVACAPAEDTQVVSLTGSHTAPPNVDMDACKVHFSFEGLLLDPLLISEAEFIVGGVKLHDNGTLEIGSIDWWASIGEDELTAALTAQTDALGKAARVTLMEDGIKLKGSYKAFLVRIPFEVKGDLTVENQTQLVFSIDKSKMAGISIPKQVNRLIQNEVNPVYDLAAFAERNEEEIKLARDQLNYEFYLQVERITPGEQHIIVVGTA